MSEHDRTFYDLLEYVERELDFESGFYNDAYLDRRVNARTRRTGHDGYRSYRRQLEDDPDEQDALLDSLSINVTGFFRNPEAWEPLGDLTVDDYVVKPVTPGGRVRVWNAPCADGREPYSVAMLALDDDDIDARHLEVLGTDINADILRVARERRDFDPVCRRNFLIYIDSDYEAPIFETITESLVDRGYLTIGMTETLPSEFRDRYDPVAKKHRIYRRT